MRFREVFKCADCVGGDCVAGRPPAPRGLAAPDFLERFCCVGSHPERSGSLEGYKDLAAVGRCLVLQSLSPSAAILE
jgi:hypothetical protein